MKALYLSYDGMTDPLGQSQVLPYLVGLSDKGHRITVVSCEKPDLMARDGRQIRRMCAAANIDWQPLTYHKQPPILSSVLDLRAMRRRAAKLQRRSHFNLVHCRSYIPGLVGLWLKRKFGLALVFDMRGFWVEERVEMGLWRLSNPLFRLVHRFFKKREAQLLREADAIVSLTEAARAEMCTWPGGESIAKRTTVIPCCVDLSHFNSRGAATRQQGRKLIGEGPDTPLLLYVGSLGGNYMLDEMLDAFAEFRRVHPVARFLIVTHHPAAEIIPVAEAHGIRADDLIIRAASREEVPALIAAADVGIAFKRESFSAKACSPTKIGEMLAIGVPVIVNSRVGDTAEIIRDTRAGAVVERFDAASLASAIRQAESAALPRRDIRDAARRWFSLDAGVDRYDAIYEAIGSEARA
jgi:glycosyltransferase involved in cell wall biosynthesis